MKRLMRNKKFQNKGFTLVEVMISMTILAIVFVPLMKYFTDSLRHSALTAKRQQATMLAQSLTEQLKAGGSLVNHDDTGYVWDVPGYTEVSKTMDADTGIGTAEYSLASGDYDVVLKLTSDVDVNKTDRAVVYGIDDKHDILAVEREQGTEALFYFMSVNNSYVMEQNLLDPDCGIDYLTFDQVENAMTRTMHLWIDKDLAGFYYLKLFYRYSCAGLQGVDDTGATIVDTLDSDYLLDIKTKNLNSLYLLYDRMVEKEIDTTTGNYKLNATGGQIVKNIKYDNFYVERTASVADTDEFVLFLVCQNLTDSKIGPTEDDDYEFNIQGYPAVVGEPAKIDGSGNISSARTNILASDKTGTIVNGMSFTSEALTQEGPTIRLVKMNLEVYKKDHADTDSPYISIETTKGE